MHFIGINNKGSLIVKPGADDDYEFCICYDRGDQIMPSVTLFIPSNEAVKVAQLIMGIESAKKIEREI